MSDLSELIEPLYKATTERKIDWKVDSESRISTVQGSNLIDIIDSGRGFVRLTIRNQDGVVLDYNNYDAGNDEGKTLSSIVIKVKRDALGVDEAIEAVKRNLLRALG